MLAMQYSFTLPADYDMGIIRDRIATRGQSTDGFPGLVFKAYLFACRDGGTVGVRDNAYAPFYLWDGPHGMNAFLGGPGFVAVTGSFGWPSVKTWSIWDSRLAADFHRATFATREIVAIPRHSNLAALRDFEAETLDVDTRAPGVLGGVVGFEPTTWTAVRLRLRSDLPAAVAGSDLSVFEIGHVST
jgi:hypothetical protein